MDRDVLGRHEWFVADLAKRLGVGKNALRVAPAGMGPIPPVARVPWPVHLLGGRRGTRTAGTVGPNATRLVGPAAAAVDYPEVPPGREQPEITLESGDGGVG
jgi:hypothetical protein